MAVSVRNVVAIEHTLNKDPGIRLTETRISKWGCSYGIDVRVFGVHEDDGVYMCYFMVPDPDDFAEMLSPDNWREISSDLGIVVRAIYPISRVQADQYNQFVAEEHGIATSVDWFSRKAIQGLWLVALAVFVKVFL
jgi:hypothetical protein